MTTDDQSSRGAAATSADRIGKVFIVVCEDVRECLICEGVFTRRASPPWNQTAKTATPARP
jgi:hypothetical protein